MHSRSNHTQRDRRQVGQVNVTVAIEISVPEGRPARCSEIRQQNCNISQVDVTVKVDVACTPGLGRRLTAFELDESGESWFITCVEDIVPVLIDITGGVAMPVAASIKTGIRGIIAARIVQRGIPQAHFGIRISV